MFIMRVFGLFCGLWFCSALLEVRAEIKPEDSLQLAPGDVLRIDLPGEAVFEDTFEIDRLGQVVLPELGEVTLAGLSLDEALAELKTRFAVVFIDVDELSVSIADRRIFIRVLGFVENPGDISLPRGASLEMAFAAVGGFKSGCAARSSPASPRGRANRPRLSSLFKCGFKG